MAKTDIDLLSAFNLEPTEIVKYFESKNCKISFDWHEVYEEAHAKAFTVAKMTEADLLKDTHKMLTTAIKEGWSEGKFKKNAIELFEKKGWVGKKEVLNPKTGEKQTVELGTPRRIKKIFNCNMTSAYAVGRYKEQMENVDVAPYLQYVAILDGRTRPEHRAMNGKVFRYDDPIWNTMYPPNGWNCRCLVTQLTNGDVRRKNIEVETSEGKIKEVSEVVGDTKKQNTVYTFSKGGNVYHLKPDAGWGTNLGIKTWGLDVTAWNKVQDLDNSIKSQFISQMASNPHSEKAYISWVNQIMTSGFKNSEVEKTLTWLTPKLYEKLNSVIDLNSPIIVMHNSQIGHSGENKNEKQSLTKEEYLQVYKMLNNPDEIYIDFTRPKWQQIAFVKLLQGDKCIKICVRFNQKSKTKTKDYFVAKVTTIGKINHYSISKGKDYKRIE